MARFRDVAIKTKLFAAFGIIILTITIAVITATISGQSLLDDFNETMMTHDILIDAGNVMWMDEVLTQSARNYAFTGELAWKERYEKYEIQLDSAIKRLESVSTGSRDMELLKKLDMANQELVTLELKSIALVDMGKNAEALAILDAPDYSKWKSFYAATLDEYLKLLGANTSLLQLKSGMTTNRLRIFWYGWSVMLILISFSIAVGISNRISNSIKDLERATSLISKGDLEARVPVRSHDEFGQLAISFNKMAVALRDLGAVSAERLKKITKDIGE